MTLFLYTYIYIYVYIYVLHFPVPGINQSPLINWQI